MVLLCTVLLVGACGGGGSAFDATTAAPATSEASPNSTSTSSGEAVGSTVTDRAAVDPTTLQWAQVPSYQVEFEGRGIPVAITPGGPGLVAVGQGIVPDHGFDGVVWVSTDGLTFTAVPDESDALGGLGDQDMHAVVAGGPGLVAVGTDGRGPDESAAVWVSADGVVWERVRHDEGVFGGPGDQVMFAVAAAGPGLVAVGTDWGDEASTAAVWVSADGYAWIRIEHDETVFGGESHQVMSAVTAGGSGVVAAGYDDSGPDKDVAVWISADGYAWERVPHDEGVFGGGDDQEIQQVVAGGPGLVAIGQQQEAEGWVSGLDTDPAVWVSADGVAWERIPDSGNSFVGLERRTMSAVVPVGTGVVAVGWDERGRDAVVWASADGYDWERVPHDEALFGGPAPDAEGAPPTTPTTLEGHPQSRNPSASMRLVTLGGPGLIAYGTTRLGGASITTAWTAEIPTP
jgi:hypothetical protein